MKWLEESISLVAASLKLLCDDHHALACAAENLGLMDLGLKLFDLSSRLRAAQRHLEAINVENARGDTEPSVRQETKT